MKFLQFTKREKLEEYIEILLKYRWPLCSKHITKKDEVKLDELLKMLREMRDDIYKATSLPNDTINGGTWGGKVETIAADGLGRTKKDYKGC